MIVDSGTLWPTDPDTQTVDALSVTNANRGISGTRTDYQSFSVSSTFTVGSIFLSAANYVATGTDFTLSFYEIANVNSTTATDWTSPAVQVGSTITITSRPGTDQSGNLNLEIVLDPSEQFTLNSVSGSAGYFVAITSLNTNGGGASFNWVHANTGTDIYSGGRYRRDDGNQTNTRDFGLALVAASAVPEPSTYAMLAGLAGLGYVVARRRKRN